MPEAAAQAPAAGASPAQPGTYVDPYTAYNFQVEIGNDVVGYFTETSGLGARVEAIQWREGTSGRWVHQLPGRLEYADVTLRYGLTTSRELWDWFTLLMQGQTERKNVSIILLDNQDRPVERWNLFNAWPKAWRGAPLDALGQEVAIESLTLVFEYLERGAAVQTEG